VSLLSQIEEITDVFVGGRIAFYVIDALGIAANVLGEFLQILLNAEYLSNLQTHF